MTPVLIWDLPTRLFHWLLAAGFAAAAVIALVLGDDGPLFPYHAIIGLTLAVAVALRVLWGFVGTRHARFRSFAFGPRAVLEYLAGVVSGRGKRHIGHNPGSAWAIFAMLGLLAALAITGVMLGRGYEGVKEVHEVCAYAMLAAVGAHILGVAAHSLRHRENITAGMIHGRKAGEPADAIASARPIAAVVFLVILGGWAAGLVGSYNPATQTASVPLLGATLQLGEAEGEGGYGERGDRDDDEGEDDD